MNMMKRETDRYADTKVELSKTRNFIITTQKMIAHIRKETGISLSDNEVESIFSADEEINDQTLCVLQLSDADTETSQSDQIQTQNKHKDQPSR